MSISSPSLSVAEKKPFESIAFLRSFKHPEEATKAIEPLSLTPSQALIAAKWKAKFKAGLPPSDSLLDWWCGDCGEPIEKPVWFFLAEPCICPSCKVQMDMMPLREVLAAIDQDRLGGVQI